MNVFFISLGCDKNLVDSEKMLGILTEQGYQITDSEEEADIIVINTCSFIHDAQQESVDAILEMAEYRKKGPCKALLITGCLAQRYQTEIMEEIPEVDAVIGTSAIDEIAQIAKRVAEGTKEVDLKELSGLAGCSDKRVLTTGGHYAYLKIAEGCNKHCTYCVIPSLRGNYRSVPEEILLKEAQELVDQGVKELILVAQETTTYGIDLYGKKMLHHLMAELCKIPKLRWVRVLYCYPEEIYDEMIETMAKEPKICHYLDLPIQHASNSILKRMGRKTSKEDLIEIIEKLRSKIPDIMLRTTLITGFPGETQEEHKELLEFINEMEFNRLGAFTYSQEDGTPAAQMEDQIPEEVKKNRQDDIMELQQEISLDLAEDMIGREIWVMVEGKVADENAYVSRTYGDAPNVDGYLFIQTPEVLMSGDFVKVKVTGALEYDLIGEIADECTK